MSHGPASTLDFSFTGPVWIRLTAVVLFCLTGALIVKHFDSSVPVMKVDSPVTDIRNYYSRPVSDPESIKRVELTLSATAPVAYWKSTAVGKTFRHKPDHPLEYRFSLMLELPAEILIECEPASPGTTPLAVKITTECNHNTRESLHWDAAGQVLRVEVTP